MCEFEWFDFDIKPKDKSRIIVSIGGYTQSSIWFYYDGMYYDDTKEERTLVDISLINSVQSVTKWGYLPLSNRDTV